MLINDEETLSNIETSYIKEHISSRSKDNQNQIDETEKIPENKYAPKNETDKVRFLSICQAIRDRGYLFKGKYRLSRLITLSDIPPILTFKEIENLLDSLENIQSNLLEKELVERLKAYGGFNTKTAAALVENIIDIRQNLLNNSVDLEIESELKKGLRSVTFLTDILRVISIELGGFSNNILSIDSCLVIFKHFSSWAHFETFEYYKSLRKKERDLLKEIVQSMPKDLQFEIIGSRELDSEFRFDKKSDEFEILIKEIRNIIEENVSESFLDDFANPDGIDSFWAIDMYSKGKFFLFSKQSLFHADPDYRKRLKELSIKANEDIEIQRNFLTYFRMLCHGGYSHSGSFPREECQALLNDHDLLELVWSASVAQSLNPRAAGGLYRNRENLIKQGIPEEILKTPKWWHHLDKIGFFKKSE